MMRTPTFDADGYPTEESLERVQTWPMEDGWEALFAFIREAWRYADYGYWEQNGSEYRISTAGWSGNECLISALEANFVAWTLCWFSSQCGGHYVFRLPGATSRRLGEGSETS